MRLFSGTDLVVYLFFYGVSAWLMLTAFYSLKEQHYVNTGVFNLPILLTPSMVMISMVILSSGKQISTPGILLICIVISMVLERLALVFSQSMIPKKKRRLQEDFYGKSLKYSFIIAAALTLVCFVVLKTVQPIVFSLVSLLPVALVRSIALALTVLFIMDVITIYVFLRRYPDEGKRNTFNANKNRLGEWVSNSIWKRIYRLYPSLLKEEGSTEAGLAAADRVLEAQGVLFAEGVHFQKLIWVLFVSSLLGDLTETVYVLITAHVLMRRSSLVLGPFSLVWGLGAVILTLALSRIKNQNNGSVFLAGFLFGGVFEYVCSVFTEVFFGMKFWDYSNMPFNIDGRTNLLFMFFWGVVALIWFRVLYPPLSKGIEKIPPVTGTVLAFAIAVFFACDSLVTAMVMVRTTDRKKHPQPENTIEHFLDTEYPEAVVKKLWPNMDF